MRLLSFATLAALRPASRRRDLASLTCHFVQCGKAACDERMSVPFGGCREFRGIHAGNNGCIPLSSMKHAHWAASTCAEGATRKTRGPTVHPVASWYGEVPQSRREQILCAFSVSQCLRGETSSVSGRWRREVDAGALRLRVFASGRLVSSFPTGESHSCRTRVLQEK